MERREMNDAELRMGRLFDRESGNSFMAAFDHGLVTKIPEAVNALGIVEKVIHDAVLGHGAPGESPPGISAAQQDRPFAFHGAQVGIPPLYPSLPPGRS